MMETKLRIKAMHISPKGVSPLSSHSIWNEEELELYMN